MIILMAGLPGCGKTTLARALAARTGGIVLNKDEVRAVLFPPGEIEFSTAQDDFCMKVLLEVAEYLAGKDPERKIFLDGRPFSRRYQIEEAIRVAEALRQPWRILNCHCSEATAKERLEQPDHLAANRDFQLYLKVRDTFEPIDHPHISIDTDRPLADSIDRALPALEEQFR
jgi:predicted kinase